MQPNEPTQEERLEELPEDNGTPFQPADPNPSATGSTTDPLVASEGAELPIDHPSTDASVDSAELYDEGVSGAVEVEDTSGQSAVADFTPPDEGSESEAV